MERRAGPLQSHTNWERSKIYANFSSSSYSFHIYILVESNAKIVWKNSKSHFSHVLLSIFSFFQLCKFIIKLQSYACGLHIFSFYISVSFWFSHLSHLVYARANNKFVIFFIPFFSWIQKYCLTWYVVLATKSSLLDYIKY